jgi:hypothetical protein
MIVNDGFGEIEIEACRSTSCVYRMLDNSSPNGPKVCPCVGGGTMSLPPDDLGTYSNAVGYTLQMDLSPDIFVGYRFATYNTLGASLLYREAACDDGLCSPNDSRRRWRLVVDCETLADADPNEPHLPSSYTVNSLSPLNISYVFDHGTGYGPTGPSGSLGGDTYTTSVVLSETT